MGHFTRLCILMLFVSASGCESTHKKSDEKHSVNKPDTVKKGMLPKPPPPGLSPNTNRIKAEVLAVQPEENGKEGIIKIKVLKSLGTGSSAPAIAPNDTLIVKVPALPDSLHIGIKFIGILQYHEVLAKFKANSPRWILVHAKQENKQ